MQKYLRNRGLKPNFFVFHANPYKLYITLKAKLFPTHQSLFHHSSWPTGRAMAKTRHAHGTFPTLSFNIKRFLKPSSFNNIPNPYKQYITLKLKLFPKRQFLSRKSKWPTDRAMAKTRTAHCIFPTLLFNIDFFFLTLYIKANFFLITKISTQ